MYYNSFSKRLKEAMNDIGIKQVDLANKTGLDKSLISNYISNKYKPKQNNLYILAEVLKVNPVWLMGYDVDKNNDTLISDTQRDNILTEQISNLAKNKQQEELLIKCTMLDIDNQNKVLELVNMYLKEQEDYCEQDIEGKWKIKKEEEKKNERN